MRRRNYAPGLSPPARRPPSRQLPMPALPSTRPLTCPPRGDSSWGESWRNCATQARAPRRPPRPGPADLFHGGLSRRRRGDSGCSCQASQHRTRLLHFEEDQLFGEFAAAGDLPTQPKLRRRSSCGAGLTASASRRRPAPGRCEQLRYAEAWQVAAAGLPRQLRREVYHRRRPQPSMTV